jgi:hypothetical protein
VGLRRDWFGGAPKGGQVITPTNGHGMLTASPPAELLDGTAHQNEQ